MISTLLVPIGAIIFLNLNRFYQFLVLSFSALLPFSFGDFRSIPSFMLIEWLPFVTMLIIINELNPINKIEKNLNLIRFKGIGIFIVAIIILIIWTTVSLVDNQLMAKQISGINKEGVSRLYFGIVANIILFFTVVLFAALYFEQIDFKKFFKIMLYFALFLGALRLFVHFIYPMDIPFLEGKFNVGGYYGMSHKNYGGRAYRFQILNDVVSMGIPALFSYYVYTKKINFIALSLLLLYLFLSGGRTIAAGIIIPIIIFSFIFFPKNFIYMIVGGGLFFFVALLILPENLIVGQAGRMTTFKEGYMGLDLGRTLVYGLYLETFSAYPIWGKGIGEYSEFILSTVDVLQDFGRKQLIAGGHGSYLSILAIFGLGGITYFLLMLFGGLVNAYKKINMYLNKNDDKTAIAVFAFMTLMIKSFDYLTAENGLSIPIFFYIVGLTASLTILQNKEDLISDLDK